MIRSLLRTFAMWALSMPALVRAAPPRPALVVAISVDQFSAGLFDQYRSTFRAGLGKLVREGAVFPNGYQSHAATETCPGHSTLLTGRHPSATGIVSNQWYVTARTPDGQPVLEKRYCAWDPAAPVPGRPGQPRGPGSLRVSTLGEWMRRAEPRSRTVAVSGKDRAALMMGGHAPTAVFWWDEERGFNTNVPGGTTERERLAPVRAFDDELARRWARHRPDWRVAAPRCAALVGHERYGDLSLAHVLPPPPPAGRTIDEAFRRWVRASPLLDELTLELALRLVKRLELGKRGVVDLLAVSLSATDYVGHTYGNQGPEMCDQLAHLDRSLGSFFAALDALKISYAVVLTADHGAMDAAERVSERGVRAFRVGDELLQEVNHELRADPALQLSEDPLVQEGDGVFFRGVAADDPRRPALEAAARHALASRPEIAAVYSRAEALATRPPAGKGPDELTLLERFSESVDAERSGDLLVALKPYATTGVPQRAGDYVAGHGSPWNYDRRVPILFWAPGLGHFEQSLPIETVDIAPTLAALVGVPIPSEVTLDGVCRDLDRGPASTCAP